MSFVAKYASRLAVQTALIFFVSLILIFAAWQLPFTYTVNAGLGFNDSWELTKGWGDAERNEQFSYRWTIDSHAEVRLPDVGWPSQVKVVAVAPRPDNTPLKVTLDAGGPPKTFTAEPANSVSPPDQAGRLTFEAAGPRPQIKLNPNRLLINSDLYQPKGDTRELGLVVSQISVNPQPRFGFVVPPLAPWLGWSLAISLLFFSLGRFFTNRVKYAALGGLLVFVAARLIFPQWLSVNGAGLAWGAVLPLIIVAIRPKWLSVWLWVLVVGGLLMVYYGLAPAAFAATICVVCAFLFLLLALHHHFKSHLENTGLLAALSIGATWGLLQGQLTRSNDIPAYHLYWVNELDRMIQQGNWYPRFAPDFNWGQGGMVFNYYGPMTRYLVEFGHLAGLTFANAMMLHQVAALLFGTIGCYFWCDEILKNRLAAVLGALAFCYFPYNIGGLYQSGWIGNTWAGAFLPWVFLLLTRVVCQPQSRTLPVWLGICVAGLPLNNNPQCVIFMPLGAIYLAGLLFMEWRQKKLLFWRTFINIGLGAVLTVAITAFFSIPTFLELDKVSLADVGAHASFFAVWPDDLALWRPIFPNMEDYQVLGTLHFVLAAIGAVVIWFRRPDLRSWAGLLGGLVAICFFFQWPASAFFWDTFPFFAQINFSSRLMAPAIVFAVPLIGALALGKAPAAETAKPLQTYRWRLAGMTVVTALIIYGCLYKLDYVYWPVKFDGFISQKALTEQVYRGDVHWLPRGLENLSQIDGYFPPTFNDKRPGDSLVWRNTGPDSFEMKASLSTRGQVTVPLLWFSDSWWKVTDQTGRSYVTTAAEEGRRMMFTLDAGQYTVSVKFNDPPVRTFSNILSVISSLAVLAYLVIPPLRRRKVVKPQEIAPAEPLVVAGKSQPDAQS